MTHKYIKSLAVSELRMRLEWIESLVSRFENDTNTIYCDYSLIKEMTKYFSFVAGRTEDLYEFLRKAEDATEEDRPPLPDSLRHLRNNKKENNS